MTPPLSDQIITAVSRMLADDPASRRDPSHSAIGFQVERAGLGDVDPGRLPKPIGKEKRVREVLSWAFEHNPEAGQNLVSYLVAAIRGSGGFRPTSPNFVGAEEIENARDAFRAEGFVLDGVGFPRDRKVEGALVRDALADPDDLPVSAPGVDLPQPERVPRSGELDAEANVEGRPRTVVLKERLEGHAGRRVDEPTEPFLVRDDHRLIAPALASHREDEPPGGGEDDPRGCSGGDDGRPIACRKTLGYERDRLHRGHDDDLTGDHLRASKT